MKHTTLLDNGTRRTVEIVYQVAGIGVHRGTNTTTRDRWVLTNLDYDRAIADRTGAILSFATLESALVALGCILTTQYGYGLSEALQVIRKGGTQ